MQTLVRYRWVRPLLIVVMLLSMMISAVRPAHAELIVDVVRHFSNADFVQGTLGLTALIEDDGFQLLPVGTIQDVNDGAVLCKPLADMGTASHEMQATISGLSLKTTYFYMIGGRTTSNVESRDTCYSRINSDAGTLDAWQASTQLPRAVYKNQAVAVPSTSGNGYVYSFGGAVGTSEESIDTIYRATINNNGTLGSWVTSTLTLPTNVPSSRSIRQEFSIFSFTNDAGQSFIYLFGGIGRFRAGNFIISNTYRDAWRTQVQSDGSLSAWTQMADIPVRPNSNCQANDVGLYSAQAVTFPVIYNIGNTTGTTQTGYLMGGKYRCNADNAEAVSADVLRMTLGENGSLTWDTSWSGQTGTNLYVIPAPIYGHQAVGFNQKIYIIGGQESGQPSPSQKVLGGIATGDQSLAPVEQANFYSSNEVFTPALYLHSTEFGRYRNYPIVYIFGGKSGASSTAYSDKVYYAKPGADERGSGGFANNGTYLSTVMDMTASGTPLTVTWTTIMTNSTVDAEVSFRVASQRSDLFSANWQLMDAVPATDRNSVFNGGTAVSVAPVPVASQITGRYIQYRVKLEAPDANFTPVFKSLVITARIDGFPNLQTVGGSISEDGPVIDISNSKPFNDPSALVIVDADVESEGTFFVDMYVFPPESTIVTPTFGSGPDDEIDGDFGQYYTEINRADLDANESRTIFPLEWKHANGSSVTSWENAFNQTGTWTIFIAVDTGGNVTEADPQSPLGAWESDESNIYMFTYDSTFVGGNGGIYIPIIRR